MRKTKRLRLSNTRAGAPITREEQRIQERIERKHQKLRRTYPEVNGKVVDFISHTIEDDTLYFTVRFKDKTDFSLRYTSQMIIVGADLSDAKTGDYDIIREYMRPVIR